MWRIALICGICTAADAQENAPAQTFYDQCIAGSFRPGLLNGPSGFSNAQPISAATVLSGVPANLLEVEEVWLLNPDAAELDQLLLAWGAMDEHSMGPMEVCLLLVPQARTSFIDHELVRLGASAEGGFFFFIRPDAAWMVNTNGSDEAGGGEVAIIGITPDASP